MSNIEYRSFAHKKVSHFLFFISYFLLIVSMRFAHGALTIENSTVFHNKQLGVNSLDKNLGISGVQAVRACLLSWLFKQLVF